VKQILDEQRRAGFEVPQGFMIVGFPLGNARHENAEWAKWGLPDGREIGIASTDSGKIAREFLLTEKRVGRRFGFGDVPTIDGVRVAYLNQCVFSDDIAWCLAHERLRPV
jgi:hypothetical protein